MLLLVAEDGSQSIPSSACVFNALGYGEELPLDVANPQDDLPEFSFSKIGLKLSLELRAEEDGTSILTPRLTRLGRAYDNVCLPVPVPSHVIIDKRWFPIIEGVDEANKCLEDAGISAFGEISLSQYCRLVSLNDAGCTPKMEIKGLEHALICPEASPSSMLDATLYPYQRTGLSWLTFMSQRTRGCILGDEMGLGKTLQVIALLLARHEAGYGTSLVVAPVSLLENWRRELERFAPTLRVLVHHGSGRSGYWKTLAAYDVVLLSYGSAVNDLSVLRMHTWDVLVLDEAQYIKNPDSQRSRAIKRIPHTFGIAVTGTPFENHVTDVWSIMEFVEPLVLGTKSYFEHTYSDDPEGAALLEPAITPFLLRRTIDEVADDLPPRIDATVPLVLSPEEAERYEDIRLEKIKALGGMGMGNPTLGDLTKLREFCTHPSLLGGRRREDPYASSVKYQQLCLLMNEIAERGEKTLICTSFLGMFDILQDDLPNRLDMAGQSKLPVYVINGGTPVPDRQAIIDEFSAVPGAAVLALNPAAAGVGLNITAATNVIHYNLEWNPAKEDQATARAHRRGQTRPVRVYRLYYVDTVEQVILDRMDLKREMARNAIVGTDGTETEREAIFRALEMSPLKRHGN